MSDSLQISRVRAGDTELLRLTFGLTATEELTIANVTAAVLFARHEYAETNHVSAAPITVVSVTSTDNGDGTWAVSAVCSFDPTGNAIDGGDAFGTGTEGTYYCYVRVTWSDGDQTRHPPRDDRTLRLDVAANFEE